MMSQKISVLLACSDALKLELVPPLEMLGYRVESLSSPDSLTALAFKPSVILWEEGWGEKAHAWKDQLLTPIVELIHDSTCGGNDPRRLPLPTSGRCLCRSIEWACCQQIPSCDRGYVPPHAPPKTNEAIRLRGIVENLPGAVFILDANATITYLNHDFWQYTASSAVGEVLLHRFSPTNQSVIKEGLSQVLLHQSAVEVVLEEQQQYYGCRFMPFADRTVMLLVEDISSQRRLEMTLRWREQSYRTMVENQLEFFLRFNHQGTIEYASPAYCQLVGKNERELIGQSCIDLVHPSDRQKAEAAIQQLLAPPYASYGEERTQTPQGWQWIGWSRKSLLGDQQEILGFLSLGRDIHCRKMAEIALLDSEEKLRFLAENIDQVFWISDLQGNLLYVNPAYERIWGESCESLYQEPLSWLKFVHPEDYENTCNHFLKPYTEDFSCIYRLIPADDSLRWIEARRFAVNIEGKPYRILQTSTDVTDRVLSEEHRRALEKERYASEVRNQFFSMISHELRTPLTSILTSIGILLFSQRLGSEKLTRNLERIQGSAQYMLELIENSLTLGRAEAGALQENPMPLLLEKFCRQLIDEISRIYGREGDGKLVFPKVPPSYICMDEILLRMILSNLLVNAFKFSAAGSPVELKVTLSSHRVEIKVADRGVGIPQSEINHIFKPFYHQGKGRGTGLGLAVVDKCVKAMGGEISVGSIAGEGSVFTATLPYLLPQDLGYSPSELALPNDFS